MIPLARSNDTPGEAMKQLDDSQLQAFDQEYMYEQRWRIVREAIERDFPDGQFTFIDVGGGNGMFANRVLATYPGARGTVLDNSRLLLGRNAPHPRKTLLCDSAERLAALNVRYDIVFYNWVLHHLVGASYGASRANIDRLLGETRKALTPRGRVSIFENMYDGALVDSLPSRLIFALTATPSLRPVTRRFGANTAGTGVCFLSRRQWVDTLNRAGLATLSYHDDDPFPFSRLHRLCLHLGYVRPGHFWLSAGT